MPGYLESLMNPATMGMLNLGAGLLAASGPSPFPVSTGAAIGRGLQQGLGGYSNAVQLQQQAALNKAKMDALGAQKNHPLVAPPGSQLFRQGENTPFATVPFRPEPAPQIQPQSPIGKLAADLQSGLITQDQFNEQFKKLTAPPQPLVTVDNRQPTKFNEEVGTELGRQYAGLLKADMNAPATIAKYERLGNLLGGIQTGKFKGATTDIKAAAKGLGIDLGALGVTDDVAPAQAARALSNQLALEMRNPSGGAGMPGAMSDQDRQFLTQIVPSLENDPNAIGKMIEYRVKIAKREQEVAKKARAYRKAHGGVFDEGFFDELQEWSNKNPLFPQEGKPDSPGRVKRYNPATGKIE